MSGPVAIRPGWVGAASTVNPQRPSTAANASLFTLCGTPDQVLEQMARLAEAGLERIMLQHLLHDDIESVELIGREVIPQALAL